MDLAPETRVADGWWTRLRGLLGRPELGDGEGLLLSPCRSVHSWGMRYPIDVVFIDGDGRAVALYPALPPRRRTAWHGDARQALELPAGVIERSGTVAGDLLRIEPSELTPPADG